MKKYIVILIVFALAQIAAFSQCGVNEKELRNRYCSGVYLTHAEYLSSSPKVEIMLRAGNKYAIYLLNASHPVNKFSLINSHHDQIGMKSVKHPGYLVFTCTPEITDRYSFSVDFDARQDACVLWAIYLQNESSFRPGIYNNFEELKYNNPSIKLEYQVKSKIKKYNREQYLSYKLVTDRVNAKKAGNVYGFSDGKDLYINVTTSTLKPGTEFVKAEYMDRFYYLEEIQMVPVSNGTTTIVVPQLVRKIIDVNTGEVLPLNKKNLKEIMADNPRLVDEFDQESQKNQKLKEYLVRYLEIKYRDQSLSGSAGL